VDGLDAYDWLGELTVGDVNDDGVGDLIMGATGDDGPVGANAGAVYVLFGGPDLLGSVDLNGQGADLVVYGAGVDDGLGHSLATGDLNGDGVADLVIGADYADVSGRADAGAVYVIFGHPGLGGSWDLSQTGADLTIYGAMAGDRLGRAVAVGNVNGDAYPDLLVGAFMADVSGGEDAGAVYVLFGGPDLGGVLDLNASGADLVILGAQAYDRLGRSVSSGDVNGDGLDDLILGAYMADPLERSAAGESYVIYGDAALPGVIDLSTTSADVTLYGAVAGDQAGFYVTSDNLNGDVDPGNGRPYDDLVITAYFADPQGRSFAGETYLVFGGPALPTTIDLANGADVTIAGAAEGDRLGRSATTGDYDADGLADLILGASRADPGDPAREDAGIAYLLLGRASWPLTLDLAGGEADVAILGDEAGGEAGRAVAAGDLNGNGVADVVVGALLANGQAGEVYAIFDEQAPPPTPTPSATPTSTATWTPTTTETPTAHCDADFHCHLDADAYRDADLHCHLDADAYRDADFHCHLDADTH